MSKGRLLSLAAAAAALLAAQALPGSAASGVLLPAQALTGSAASGALPAAQALTGAPPAPGAAVQEDVLEQLRRMSGCFEVEYRFVEDGAHDVFSPGWQLDAPVLEWVGFERAGDGEVVLPHVAITPGGRAVPHWYELWRREPSGDGWTQEVWSHSPDHEDRKLRYRCTAPWSRNTWSCRAGRAPKPFRDDGAPFGFDRKDYEWLDRDNTLLVTPAGWVQYELNRKMTAEGELAAYELGWIVYRRVDEAKCAPAIEAGSSPEAR